MLLWADCRSCRPPGFLLDTAAFHRGRKYRAGDFPEEMKLGKALTAELAVAAYPRPSLAAHRYGVMRALLQRQAALLVLQKMLPVTKPSTASHRMLRHGSDMSYLGVNKRSSCSLRECRSWLHSHLKASFRLLPVTSPFSSNARALLPRCNALSALGGRENGSLFLG